VLGFKCCFSDSPGEKPAAMQHGSQSHSTKLMGSSWIFVLLLTSIVLSLSVFPSTYPINRRVLLNTGEGHELTSLPGDSLSAQLVNEIWGSPPLNLNHLESTLASHPRLQPNYFQESRHLSLLENFPKPLVQR